MQRLLRVATVRVDFKRLWGPLSKIQIDGMSHQPNKQLLNIYCQRHCVGCMTSHKVDLRLKGTYINRPSQAIANDAGCK